MSRRHELIAGLADGRFHSGQALAARLGISRSAVWKHLHALSGLGIDVASVPGKGYRLPAPIELLDAQAILDQLHARAAALVSSFEIHPEIDSTNHYLAGKARAGAPSGTVCLAESQSAGRGRWGRQWVSPFGANLYLSVLWRFTRPPEALAGLSLAAGVALGRALAEAGLPDVGLKWPNDVIWHERKLAGILIELAGECSGPSLAVLGVGLNVRMPATAASSIDQPWCDVQTIAGHPHSRNRLAALLLSHILVAMEEFAEAGLDPFLPEWREMDRVAGRMVSLHHADQTVTGLATGVSPSGELLLSIAGAVRAYAGGEVSLRPPA